MAEGAVKAEKEEGKEEEKARGEYDSPKTISERERTKKKKKRRE